MLDFIGSIIFLVIFIVMIVLSVKEHKTKKKQHEELIAAKNDLRETYIKMIVALDNLKIDTVEYNSIKRWVGSLLDQLAEHSEKMDDFTTQMNDITKPSFIIKDVEIDIEAAHIPKTGVFSFPENATIEMVNTDLLQRMKELVAVQGMPGNWDQDEYMRGMYNGMELMLATAEQREPVFKDPQDIGKGADNDEQ
ncbi:hypothetical protein NYE67_20625 [Solibacillus sp. FSL W8-0474]|uniref:hypothetical protein n=1 Tax=Solibacillus sp. FSL W8-0474 TaxID=2975336 RepID=UPI0030FA1D4C